MRYSFSYLLPAMGTLTKAEFVLPVFSGNWYDDVQCVTIDSCRAPVYTYKDLDTNPEDIATKNLDLPEYSSCTWGVPYIKETWDIRPSDFPSTIMEQWDEILATSGSELMTVLGANCTYIDSDGTKHVEYTSSYTTVSPQYVCPEGSRYAVAEYEDDRTDDYADYAIAIGCTTTPDPCFSDVVGRDFDSTGGSYLGHVGLSGVDYVLEVLVDPVAGIYFDNLDDFKQKTVYWGEAYGLPETEPEPDRLDYFIAIDILEAGYDQMQYNFTYASLWDYYPGGTEAHPCDCYFRCDSFVYYAYDAGGIKIADEFSMSNFLLGPESLFSTFLYRSSDEPPAGKAPEASTLYRLDTALSNDTLIRTIGEIPIDTPSGLLALAQNLQQWIEDPTIQRAEKLDAIWSWILHYENDSVRFAHGISFMESMNPLELAPELIALFEKTSDLKEQIQLISVLKQAALYQKDSKNSEIDQDQNENLYAIQKLFKNLLYTTPESAILETLATCPYQMVFPADEAKADLSYALNREDLVHHLTAQQQIFIFVRIALSTKEAQRSQLPELLDTYGKAEDPQLRELFARCLCFELANHTPNDLHPEVREALAQFLLKYEHLSQDNFALLLHTGGLQNLVGQPPIGKWLRAYATIQANTTSTKEQFMLDYIADQESAVTQANLVSSSGPALRKSLTVEKRSQFGLFFKAACQSSEPSEEDRARLQLGLQAVGVTPEETCEPAKGKLTP